MAASEADKAAANTARREVEARCLDAGLSIRVNETRYLLNESDLPPHGPPDPCGPPIDPSKAPFDPIMATVSLGRVRFEECSIPSGPHGSGHAKITFGLNGKVVSVEVDPPFARTPVGRCLAAKLHLVQIPPFAGSPVTVGKAFNVH
jgi:hypothetical protein